MSNHHIENATSWLNAVIVDVHDITPAGQQLRAELAQAHATLAIAHELRTANLLAHLDGLIRDGIKGQDVLELEEDILTRLRLGEIK